MARPYRRGVAAAVAAVATAATIAALWLAPCLPAQAYAFQPYSQTSEAPAQLVAEGTIQAAFAPWDDAEGLIIGALAVAQHEILVQAYLLTSKKIVGALREARQRGVDVSVMVDAAQITALPLAQKQITALRESGIAVWGETAYANAHNKVIVIDAGSANATLITGSYNFTWSAQHKNAENILIIRGNAPLALLYAANWERHRRTATLYD
jgi:phosphatidylserine/phosphatidylglycerophosphate/cardiolipin synthase-like enzyme